VPQDYNPVGTYRKVVDLDSEFLSEDVILHFEAIKAVYIYVNGQYAGYAQGSKTSSEFNISKYLNNGRNLIALQMYRWTDACYLESQDMLRMSGIERDVYLYTRPKIYIEDYYTSTTLDDNYDKGIFNGRVTILNESDQDAKRNVFLEILKGETSIYNINENLSIDANSKVNFNANYIIEKVKQWSAETPNLYTIKIALTDADNQDNNQHITKQFGFKRVEIKNSQVLINGKAIYIRGVDRHETDPFTGHVVSQETMLKDIRLMKQNNINACLLYTSPSPRD